MIQPPSAASGLRYQKLPFAMTILVDIMILEGVGSVGRGHSEDRGWSGGQSCRSNGLSVRNDAN